MVGDTVRYEYSRVPGQLEPIEIPVGYADLNGDGSEYALKTYDGSSGGGGTTLGTPKTTSVDVTGTAAYIVSANFTRLSLLIINNSATDPIYLRGDGAATPDRFSIKVAPGGSFSTDKTGAAYSAIADAGKTVSVTIEEIATIPTP